MRVRAIKRYILSSRIAVRGTSPTGARPSEGRSPVSRGRGRRYHRSKPRSGIGASRNGVRPTRRSVGEPYCPSGSTCPDVSEFRTYTCLGTPGRVGARLTGRGRGSTPTVRRVSRRGAAVGGTGHTRPRRPGTDRSATDPAPRHPRGSPRRVLPRPKPTCRPTGASARRTTRPSRGRYRAA